MLKRLIKYFVALGLYYTGLLSLYSRIRRRLLKHSDVLILMYHRVLDKNDSLYRYTQSGLSCSPEFFERQMTFLVRHYNVISLSALVELLRNTQPVPPRTVVVTFDDGWRDNYIHAFPVIKKHQVPATIFLATDFIETGRLFWFLRAGILLAEARFTPERIGRAIAGLSAEYPADAAVIERGLRPLADHGRSDDDFLEWLKQFEPSVIDRIIDFLGRETDIDWRDWSGRAWTISWGEVREMAENGVEFGSHGCSHAILTRLKPEAAVREIRDSRRIIELELGRDILLFAYPNGDYNTEIIDMVKKAGYHGAIKVGPLETGSELNIFALPRAGAHDGMSAGPFGGFSTAMFAFELRP